MSGRHAGRPLLKLRAVQFRKPTLREWLVGVEIRRIDTKPCSEGLNTGAARREFVEAAEAGEGFGLRTADHQRQTRQNGEMPRIAPILPRAVFDIGVVSDRFFKSRLYREYDLSNARRKVAPLWWNCPPAPGPAALAETATLAAARRWCSAGRYSSRYGCGRCPPRLYRRHRPTRHPPSYPPRRERPL